eukprot:UC1_evm1s655
MVQAQVGKKRDESPQVVLDVTEEDEETSPVVVGITEDEETKARRLHEEETPPTSAPAVAAAAAATSAFAAAKTASALSSSSSSSSSAAALGASGNDNSKDHWYRMVASVLHVGDMVESGHYKTDAYDADKRTWTNYNDSVATQLAASNPFSARRQRDAYILFYEYQ